MTGDQRDEIRFTEQEWHRASDLAVSLLSQLEAPKCCEHCPGHRLLPNYKMKYELAKALRAGES